MDTLIFNVATITQDELNMSMEPGSPFALVDVLLRHKVPLVIIGGHAVIFHGYLRTTEDIDIVFTRSAESEASMFAALTEVEAYWIGNEIDPATGIERTYPVTKDYIAHTHLMMLGTRLGYLDVFDFVPELHDQNVQQLIDSAIIVAGRPFVSLDWLQQMKRASKRPKDQEDLHQLLR